MPPLGQQQRQLIGHLAHQASAALEVLDGKRLQLPLERMRFGVGLADEGFVVGIVGEAERQRALVEGERDIAAESVECAVDVFQIFALQVAERLPEGSGWSSAPSGVARR